MNERTLNDVTGGPIFAVTKASMVSLRVNGVNFTGGAGFVRR